VVQDEFAPSRQLIRKFFVRRQKAISAAFCISDCGSEQSWFEEDVPILSLIFRMSSSDLLYCPSPYAYQRRRTRVVQVGRVQIGGDNPVRVQSMLTSDTRDTEACVAEALGLVEAGCEIVRVTAQTRVYAANLENIKATLLAKGCDVPLVADIHFKPDAALEAAKWVEKVRINPGNYADKKKFEQRDYTDAEYAEELERIREEFVPLVRLCQERGVAMRIGTNHGSLSDRIMNRFGDTPHGMVESALEFARIAREEGYHNFLFSMKASNPKVMIEAYRLLVASLDKAGPDWNYPIHLGVTEAGDGEDGRTKSAIGIGSLLSDGIGDTIRVSLTEDAVYEIPVARALRETAVPTEQLELLTEAPALPYNPFVYERRASAELELQGLPLGGANTVRVMVNQAKWNAVAHKLKELGEYQPELILETSGVEAVDPRDAKAMANLNARIGPVLVTVADGLPLPVIAAFRLLAANLTVPHPILLKDTLTPTTEDGEFLPRLLRASTNIGALLCDGIGDAVYVQGEPAPNQSLRMSYNILQAAGTRIFKTDYVACPSCGRTLFNLQTTTQKIREATGHLKGVRIAVMGCIVNGPGEMADADFGYVGGAPNKINLYVGKTPVEFNIPEAQAVAKLVDLIKSRGRWIDAPV
jgi:(E)-4-hydroxy-3-methylbut-2-enyl-diphosphate synthase